MSVRTGTVLSTIQAAIDGLNLPAPTAYRVGDTSIRLGFRDPADVDAWARHIGLHPASVTTASGMYTAVEFWADDSGWCGAAAVTLAAPIPHEAVA